MKEARIRNLPITNKENELVGMVTLREIVDYLVKKSKRNTTHEFGKRENDNLIRNKFNHRKLKFIHNREV